VGRVVLLHGFTQTRDCWGPVASGLAAAHEVVALDLPGHGSRSDAAVDLAAGAPVLADAGGTGTWLGYSLGARWALGVALADPAVVRSLVLVGGTAGIADAAERARRRAEDEARAAQLEEVGVDAFVQEWVHLPLFAGVPEERRCVEARRSNTVAGLASSLRLTGQGAVAPMWDRLGAIRVPVLVVAGAEDRTYAALGERLVAALPSATLAVVPGAGHAAHLEQPEAFLDVVLPWLSAVWARERP
jgi:2-succinyl-6-hydroxy-2,4-cyclohexadiene-1-carboxylate synthase